jgi:predicted RNA binding protein YcfA (HicA-like mRNA interferase family)
MFQVRKLCAPWKSLASQLGSHVVLRRGSMGCVVPLHRELKIGTLSGVLKQAGITADEFMQVL